MFYIALIEAYLRGEREDNWFSSDYMAALQLLILKEAERQEGVGNV